MDRPLRDVSPCGRRQAWIVVGARILLAALILLGAGAVHAQMTPMRDLVPLDELETPTDDLIRLATAYTDALRELKNAQLSLETLESLKPNVVITCLEIQIARVNTQMAQRKLALITAVVQRQLATATARLEILRRMEMLGQQAPPGSAPTEHGIRIAHAEESVKILKMILETN